MDQAGCSGRDPNCLTPSETGVGISARIYNSNSFGDKAGEDPGNERRHAGTVEGISARIHVANSHGDRAEEGRRSDRRHSASLLWERDDSCMSVGASIVVTGVRVDVCWSGCVSRAGGVHGSGIDKSIDENIDGSDSEEGDHPTRHPRLQPCRDLMPRVKRGCFVLRRGKHPGQRNCPGCLRMTSEFLFSQSKQQQRMKRRTAVQ